MGYTIIGELSDPNPPTRTFHVKLGEPIMSTVSFRTIAEIKRLNQETGRHFFDADTLRFFQSRILDGVIGGRYFITSERRPGASRRYTVREAQTDGSIDTVGEFQQYASADSARRAARRLAGE